MKNKYLKFIIAASVGSLSIVFFNGRLASKTIIETKVQASQSPPLCFISCQIENIQTGSSFIVSSSGFDSFSTELCEAHTQVKKAEAKVSSLECSFGFGQIQYSCSYTRGSEQGNTFNQFVDVTVCPLSKSQNAINPERIKACSEKEQYIKKYQLCVPKYRSGCNSSNGPYKLIGTNSCKHLKKNFLFKVK